MKGSLLDQINLRIKMNNFKAAMIKVHPNNLCYTIVLSTFSAFSLFY